MKKPYIVVIGSADVIKLCVIRSLGAFGCDIDVVHVGKKGRIGNNPVDYYSRYVSHYYFTSKSELIHVLLEKCTHSYVKPILFTLDDNTTFLIDNARDKLDGFFLFSHLLSNGHLGELMNKHLLKTKAAEAGMNVVKGWSIPFENGEFQIPDGIKYPCFVKGLLSNHVSKSVQCRCDDETALRRLLASCKKNYPYPVYAEEFIPIEKDFGVIGISDGKKCLIPARADLIELGKGSTNGVSMLGKVSPFDKGSHLYKQIESLLSELKYVGIFNIDFVESKGVVYFVELNFRFAAYGYGVFRAGVNLPAIFAESVESLNLNLIDLQATIDNDYYYLNEKIGLMNVLEKSISWAKYKELKKKADFLMVKSKDDSKPYRMFLFKMALKCLKGVN